MSTSTTSYKLPKWSQMIVSGVSVTEDQAKDIIFRTDRFFTDTSRYSGGNDREFNKFYRKISGLDNVLDDYDAARAIRDEIGFLRLNFVENDWGSSSFVYGPSGWCHPDGTIFYRFNVGKHPMMEDLMEDWSLIAREFPFLDVHVTLMDSEHCEEEAKPVFNIRVVDGEAKLLPPDLSVHGASTLEKLKEEPEFVSSLFFPFGVSDRTFEYEGETISYREEIGAPIAWYLEFANRVKPVIEKIQQ